MLVSCNTELISLMQGLFQKILNYHGGEKQNIEKFFFGGGGGGGGGGD